MCIQSYVFMYGYILYRSRMYCTLGHLISNLISKLLIKRRYFDEIAILTDKERPRLSTRKSTLEHMWASGEYQFIQDSQCHIWEWRFITILKEKVQLRSSKSSPKSDHRKYLTSLNVPRCCLWELSEAPDERRETSPAHWKWDQRRTRSSGQRHLQRRASAARAALAAPDR